MGIEVNNRKDEEENDKEFNNNKERTDRKARNNDIIELLTKGKIELSQIFIAPAIVAFGILQILSGETSPMTWRVSFYKLLANLYFNTILIFNSIS